MSRSRLSGLGAWLMQRLSAVALLLFAVVLVSSLPASIDHAAWRGFWGRPPVALATALFVAALLVHGWVGMRDVILDYVKPFALRLLMLMAVGGWLLALGLWSAWLLLEVVQL